MTKYFILFTLIFCLLPPHEALSQTSTNTKILDYKKHFQEANRKLSLKLEEKKLTISLMDGKADELQAIIMSSSGLGPFLENVHGQVTEAAIGDLTDFHCLNFIINAGTEQDWPPQSAAKTNHFDNDKICESYDLVKNRTIEFYSKKKTVEKLKLVGQIFHAVQDFYSHSNYVDSNIEKHAGIKLGEIELFDFKNYCPKRKPYKKLGEIYTGAFDGNHFPFGISKEDKANPKSHLYINKDFSPYNTPSIAKIWSPSSLKRSKESNIYYFDFVTDLQKKDTRERFKSLLAKAPSLGTSCRFTQ
jgi:hypothetical protein